MKRLRLPLLLLLASIQAGNVRAEVKAGPGLQTRVNGVMGGSCKTGVCHLDGGIDSGRNRFHRLSHFDTRGAIRGVEIQSDGIQNLVLGVTAAEGSFIDKAISLTAPSHLFVLSPGGIQMMPGARFLQIPQLTLSTASELHFRGGIFDVFKTHKAGLSSLDSDPLSGSLGLHGSRNGDDRPWIRMEGIDLDVEESLLIDAPEGRIDIKASQLSASNDFGDGGSIALSADLIKVGAETRLLATGRENGGEVLIGGSWQNSDQTVRQALQTWMQPGSLVDASSTGQGNGGTIVIWSDLDHASGGTVAEGTFLAMGGPLGGDGGRVETSGAMLIANPERVDVSSVGGLAGEWLLDPFDITISNVTGTITADPSGSSNSNVLFTSTVSASTVDEQALKQSLVDDGNNVRVLTGNGDPTQGGNITWASGADLNYSTATTVLTLDASGYIQLSSDITTGSGGLNLNAGAGFVEGASGSQLILNGPLQVSTGDSTIGTPTYGSQALASTLSGSGDLTKSGHGRLIMSGNNAGWSGEVTVESGALRVTNSNALGASNIPTTVKAGATLELSGDITLDEPVVLEGGVLRNWSGNNSLKQTLTLNGSSTVDMTQGELNLNPTTGNSVSVLAASTAFNSDLSLEGSGDVFFTRPINLRDGQSTIMFGDLLHNGPGTARFQETLFVQRLIATGDSIIWFDQASGAEVIGGASNPQIILNGATLRRDATEAVNNIELLLNSGGGAIDVRGSASTLTWDAAISGNGDFIKEGDGTLQFSPSATITYTGETFVKKGSLDVLSSSPTSATCSGGGSSNLCSSTPTPTPEPIPTKESPPEMDSDVTRQDDDRSQRLIGFDPSAEVALLQTIQQNQSQAPLIDQSSTLPNGQVVGVESSNNSIPVVVNFGETSGMLAVSPQTQNPTGSRASVPLELPEDQAVLQLQESDGQATLRTVAALDLEESLKGIAPETPSVSQIQQSLREVQQQQPGRKALVPAVLQVRFTDAQTGFLDLTFIPPEGVVQAKRVEISRARFAELLKDLYRQLSRQESLEVNDPMSPSRQLHDLLIAPVQSSLDTHDITTVLIAADQGLQAVPFSALNDGAQYFGERYGFALSPSLALTDLSASNGSQGLLAMGASEFETLAPLPLVPQELNKIQDTSSTDRYLDDAFTPQTLLDRASDPRYSRVHIATHADFRPGGRTKSVLHTGQGPMSMADFAELRRQRRDHPLDLVVLSACRTMIGDQESELGFAGLALQAGSQSAIGTLWYVDDVVTSAFFVQFYRFLAEGASKAEALLRTRQIFALGSVYLQGDEVIGHGGEPLLQDLDQSQRQRIKRGVKNPFFWAGIELLGSPW